MKYLSTIIKLQFIVTLVCYGAFGQVKKIVFTGSNVALAKRDRFRIFYSVLLIIVFSFTTSIFSQVQFTTHTITTSANGANRVYAEDLDGDGDIDVLSSSEFDNKIAWYENDGNKNFTPHTITTNAVGAFWVYAVDLDNDGDMDVLSASQFDNKIAWYENDGNENFTSHTISTDVLQAYDVYAVDLDDDGDVDVLSSGDNKITWYENDGNENFTPHTITTGSLRSNSVYAEDLDDDGDMDVLFASVYENEIAWYENDGNENFTPHTIATGVNEVRSIKAEDVDGDGDIDVLSVLHNDDKIAWYENDGNENFTLHTIITGADGPMSVYTIDVDGDEDMDMISGFWYDHKIVWYENDGNENFTPHTITTNAVGANTVYAIDVDGDEDIDVLSASFFDDKIAWYENLSPITPDLPFEDEFTGGPDPAWEIIGDYWFFDNDKVYSNVDPTYIYQYMIVGDNSWQDYTFEVDVLGTSGTDKAICFRVQDTQNFYMLHLIGPIQYHHIELYRYVNGQYTVIYQNPNYPVQNNVNYHLKVETYGNDIKIYINGVFEAEVTDDTFDSGGVALAGGWNGYAPCYVEFDNVSVYNEQSSDGLVAYYPFNGNANDESGNGNDATVFGASLTVDRFGSLNSAYSFDGIDDYLLVPDDKDLRFGTTDFTIDVWAKCSFVPEKRTLIEKRIGNAEYLIDVRLDGTIRGAIVDAANNNVVIYSTTNITDDRWHHIAMVRDAGTSDLLKLYIDGVMEVSDSYPTLLDVSTTGDITFGRDIVFDRYFDGIMDDIHFYNRALSNSEILELYGGFNGGLVAYYPFNGNANDESGNGNDGVVYGASLTTDRFNNQNSAYYFNGVDNFIEVLNDPILNPTNFISISAWVAVDDVNKLSQEIISKGADHMDGHYRMHYTAKPLQNYPDHRFQGLITRIGDNYYSMLFMGDYPLQNQWYHIVMVYNGNSLIAYLNGYQEEILSVSGNLFQNDANLYIGKHMNASYPYYFSGKIDEIRIYDYALSEEEILDLYDITIPVELTSFTATIDQHNVTLNWQTATETNNSGFEIERKLDNSVWGRIGFLEGHGTTTEPKEYSYVDNISSITANSLIYRLKQIDFDGRYEYSDEVLVEIQAPIDYALHQNYPNPFNPVTTIKYEIPSKATVQLNIYNTLGEVIQVLVNEEKPVGYYEIEFDASSFASGVYFYRLQVYPAKGGAGDFVETKKMVLIK